MPAPPSIHRRAPAHVSDLPVPVPVPTSAVSGVADDGRSGLPRSLSDITADWLVSALGEAGHEAPPVRRLELAEVGGIVGATGQIGRLRVEWDGDTGLPGSFVVKAPNTDEFSRLANEVMRFYEREAGFYREIAHRIDLPRPRCYVNAYDPVTDHNVLVIEDLAPAVDGDCLAGTDFDTARELIEMLGRLHGTFWMDRSIVADWLVTWDREAYWSNAWIGQTAWTAFVEAEPDFYPDDLARVLRERFLWDARGFCERIDRRPWTYCHGDFQLDNVLFGESGPVIVDWQLGLRNCPGNDVAWFLATSCRDHVDRERELLDAYRAALAAHGGPAWSHEELLEDLCWGLVTWVAGQPVTMVADQSHHGVHAERMRRRFRHFGEGTRDAAVRWGLAEVVEATWDAHAPGP